MNSASVIGLGNILCGDLGAGCHLIDALCQEELGNDIELIFLGRDARYAGAFMMEKEFAVVVKAVSLGGVPGNICCWNLESFQRNLPWFCELAECAGAFARSLHWARFAGCFPREVLFVWIEPKITEGLGISEEVRRAIRKVIRLIKTALADRGLLADKASTLPRIHYLDLLEMSL